MTEITEPTAANEGLDVVDLDAVQLQPLPLRARRVVVRLDAATVVLHSTNRRLRTHTRIHSGLLSEKGSGKGVGGGGCRMADNRQYVDSGQGLHTDYQPIVNITMVGIAETVKDLSAWPGGAYPSLITPPRG